MKNNSRKHIFKGIEQSLLLIDEMRRKVGELERELQERERIADAQARDLEHLRGMLSQKNNELRRAVENYQNSMSWRITKPLRMVHEKLFSLVRRGEDGDKTVLQEQEERTIPELSEALSPKGVGTVDESGRLRTPPEGEVFVQPWYRFFRRKILVDKLSNRLFYASRPLTVGMAITEDTETTPAGDYYTAKGLGKELARLGYTLKYLPRIPGEKWYHVPDDIDILIVLIDGYDLPRVMYQRPMLKIAWVRSCVEQWIEHEWFKEYDFVFASSEEARRIVRERTGKGSELLMIGADTDLFQPMPPQERYACDIVFTGNYWGIHREIIGSLVVQPEWKCSIYGINWGNVESLKKYWKGFINYAELSYLYSSSKIVLDDHIREAKPFGTINSRVFEAMACGCCVVTNAAKDIDKVFPEGTIMIYHDGEELTRILTELLSDGERRVEMGQKAREAILGHHTYKKRADQFRKILLKAAEDEIFY